MAAATRTRARLRKLESLRWFLQGVVQPFATIVMRILLWMRATLNLNYGWVLVIFGVVVRLSALAAQPEGHADEHEDAAPAAGADRDPEEVQGDPQRMQAEIMRVYRSTA